jgi:hypothetical protein
MKKRALLNAPASFLNNPIMSLGVNAPYGVSNPAGTGWSLHYASWALAMPAALKAAIKASGFTAIRLYVDPIPLFTAANDFTIKARLASGPLIAVADLVAYGFTVQFDFHIQPSPSTPAGWGTTDVIAIASTNDVKFQRLVHCGVLAAQALLPYMPNVRFELFNEPPPVAAFTGISWATQLTYYYNAIRAVAPLMPLVVSPMNSGSIDTLIATPFDPTPFDKRTYISVHDYNPAAFTQQGAGPSAFQYLSTTFPPGNFGQTLASTQASSTALINSDPSLTGGTPAAYISFNNGLLSTYFSTPQNVAYLQARLASAATWADAHGVARNRLLLGEFGAVGPPSADNTRPYYPTYGGAGADAASRAAYYNTIAYQIKVLGGGFSVHVEGADFFEITDGTQVLVPSIIKALFTFAVPVNISLPAISGSAQVGQTLTAGEGSWNNSPVTYAYQWSDSSTGNIGGATSKTYAPVSGNIGHTLSVSIIATNGSGSSAAAISAPSAAVIAAGSGGVLDFSQANNSVFIGAIAA